MTRYKAGVPRALRQPRISTVPTLTSVPDDVPPDADALEPPENLWDDFLRVHSETHDGSPELDAFLHSIPDEESAMALDIPAIIPVLADLAQHYSEPGDLGYVAVGALIALVSAHEGAAALILADPSLVTFLLSLEKPQPHALNHRSADLFRLILRDAASGPVLRSDLGLLLAEYVCDVCEVLPSVPPDFQFPYLSFLIEFATVPQDPECLTLLFHTAAALPSRPVDVSGLLLELSGWPCFDVSLFYRLFRSFVAHHFFTAACIGRLAFVLMRIDDDGGDIASLFGITALDVAHWVLADDSDSRQFALHVLVRLALSMPDDPEDEIFYRFAREAAARVELESFPLRAQFALAALALAGRSLGIAAVLLFEAPGFWDGTAPFFEDGGDADVACAAMRLFLFAAEAQTREEPLPADVGAHPAVEELCAMWEAREMAGEREAVRAAFLERFHSAGGEQN